MSSGLPRPPLCGPSPCPARHPRPPQTQNRSAPPDPQPDDETHLESPCRQGSCLTCFPPRRCRVWLDETSAGTSSRLREPFHSASQAAQERLCAQGEQANASRFHDAQGGPDAAQDGAAPGQTKTLGVQYPEGSSKASLAEVLQAYSRYAHVLPALRRIEGKLGERRTEPVVDKQAFGLRFRLGEATIVRLCEEYESGVGTTPLARRYGIAESTVYRLLQQRSIPIRSQKRGTAADRRRALRLRSEGGPIKMIAKRLGFSPATIKQWIDTAALDGRQS